MAALWPDARLWAPWRFALEQTDHVRRQVGTWLEVLGLGPVQTPSSILLSVPGMRVHDYGGPPAAPAFVIVSAPIKRSYIWDLAPRVSVVRRIAEHGFRPFLIEWRECPRQAGYGLADYADRLPRTALEAIRHACGQRAVILAGHSLGGTLAALFASLYPDRVRSLVLLEAPTRFTHAGVLASMVAAIPAGPALSGILPGSFLDLVGTTASPASFVSARWLDRIAVAADPPRLRNHLRVERWTLDEFPMSAALLRELVESLYREDRFILGRLSIGGRPATPAALDMPLLSVVRPGSRLVPPQAMLPLYDAAPSRVKQWLSYGGDCGVALQHLGPLVGEHAHRELWPRILRWVAQVD